MHFREREVVEISSLMKRGKFKNHVYGIVQSAIAGGR